MDGTMQGNGFWNDLWEWGRYPFSDGTKISTFHLFCLVGIFIVFVFAWNVLLRHLLEALSDA